MKKPIILRKAFRNDAKEGRSRSLSSCYCLTKVCKASWQADSHPDDQEMSPLHTTRGMLLDSGYVCECTPWSVSPRASSTWQINHTVYNPENYIISFYSACFCSFKFESHILFYIFGTLHQFSVQMCFVILVQVWQLYLTRSSYKFSYNYSLLILLTFHTVTTLLLCDL